MFGKVHVVIRITVLAIFAAAFLTVTFHDNYSKVITCSTNATEEGGAIAKRQLDVYGELPYLHMEVTDYEKVTGKHAAGAKISFKIESQFATQRIDQFRRELVGVDYDEFMMASAKIDTDKAIGLNQLYNMTSGDNCARVLGHIKAFYWMFWSFWFFIGSIIFLSIMIHIRGATAPMTMKVVYYILDIWLFILAIMFVVRANHFRVSHDSDESLFNDECIFGKHMFPESYKQGLNIQCQKHDYPHRVQLGWSVPILIASIVIFLYSIFYVFGKKLYFQFAGKSAGNTMMMASMATASTAYAAMFEN